jgi:hypothetical protein
MVGEARTIPSFRSTRQQRQSVVTPPAKWAARPGESDFICVRRFLLPLPKRL